MTKVKGKYIRALIKANQVCPDNRFVNSCAMFLLSRGFLSDKQMEALDNVRPRSINLFRKPKFCRDDYPFDMSEHPLFYDEDFDLPDWFESGIHTW